MKNSKTVYRSLSLVLLLVALASCSFDRTKVKVDRRTTTTGPDGAKVVVEDGVDETHVGGSIDGDKIPLPLKLR